MHDLLRAQLLLGLPNARDHCLLGQPLLAFPSALNGRSRAVVAIYLGAQGQLLATDWGLV